MAKTTLEKPADKDKSSVADQHLKATEEQLAVIVASTSANTKAADELQEALEKNRDLKAMIDTLSLDVKTNPSRKEPSGLEYKTLEFKAGSSEGLNEDEFQGYASTFGPPVDSYGDIIAPGAYAGTIADFLKDGAICWQHDWTSPIGKPVELHEDSKGLYIKGKISQTAAGKDALTLMRDGVVRKMSIGFKLEGYRILSEEEGVAMLGQSQYDATMRDLPWYAEGIRELTAIKLFEISPVTIPANNNAVVTGVKGKTPTLTLDEHFQLVRATEQEYLTRMTSLADLRAKSGRVLSEANRTKLKDMRDSVAGHVDMLDELLAATEPVVEDDGKTLALRAQYLASEARFRGILT